MSDPTASIEAWDDDLREVANGFAAFMEEAGLDRRSAARLLGVSQTTLGRMLNCTYRGRAKYIAEQMLLLEERQRLRRAAPQDLPYVETSVTERIAETLEIAHVERGITLILGSTGTGKTCASQYYAEQAGNGSVLYIEAGPGATMQAIVRKFVGMVGLDWRRAVYDMRDAVAETLAGTGKLLIVDEIDYADELTLHTLRLIQEAAHIGMAWIGTGGFLDRLRKRRSTTINQVLGRIRRVEYIPEATPPDIEAVLAPYSLDAACIKMVVSHCDGEIPRACNLVRGAQRTNGEGITPRSIQKAARALVPKVRG